MENVVKSIKKFGFVGIIAYLAIVLITHLGRVFTGTFLGGIGWLLQLVVTCSLFALLLVGIFTKKPNLETAIATLLVAYVGVGTYINAFSMLTQLNGYWAAVVSNVFGLIADLAIAFVFVIYILKVLFKKDVLSAFVPIILCVAIVSAFISGIFGFVALIVFDQPFYEWFRVFGNAFLYFGLFGYACELAGSKGEKKEAAQEEKTETAEN